MPSSNNPGEASGLGDLRGGYAPEQWGVVTRPLDPRALAEQGAARPRRDGQAVGRISHPNVLSMYEHGAGSDRVTSAAAKPVHGVMLQELILSEGPLPFARIRGLVRQLLEALAALHAADIVHADIKCANLIVDSTAGADRLMIIDFGLSRAPSRSVLGQVIVAGMPEYLAPELLRGARPTAAADLYSAAIVIYELLVGVTPFAGGRPLEVLARQLTAPVRLPAEVRASLSPELERVLLRALEKQPERRFSEARGLAIAFDRAIGGLPGAARPASSTAGARAALARDPHRDPERGAVQRRRRELDAALAGGAVEPVVIAYLDLADALIADDRMGTAERELERALACLLARPGGPPDSLWRIESLLAAMHELLGDPVRARRVAMDAHSHAVRSGCKLAEQSTHALLHRLMASRRPPGPAA